MTREDIVNMAMTECMSKFDDSQAPKELTGVSWGMHCTAFLFSSKEAAGVHFQDASADKDVKVKLSDHGYVVYLKVIPGENEPNPDAIKDIMSEVVAKCMTKAYGTKQYGWAEIHGKENELWFKEPSLLDF